MSDVTEITTVQNIFNIQSDSSTIITEHFLCQTQLQHLAATGKCQWNLIVHFIAEYKGLHLEVLKLSEEISHVY